MNASEIAGLLPSRGSDAAQVLEGLQADQLPLQLQGRSKELQGCLHMEAVVQALDVGRIADVQKHLTAAEQCLGLSSEVTGTATFLGSQISCIVC